MPKGLFQSAEQHLRKADPVMDRLISLHGPCRLGESNHSLFHSLATAIISQQLSVKAAATIHKRLMALTSNPLSPRKVLCVDTDTLRSAGLSNSKAVYLQNLAGAVDRGTLSKAKLKGMDDAEAVKQLTAIKGIGAWTAEMYLIFGLRRPDVLSLGDAGLQRAARELYNGGRPKDGLLAHVSNKWKPYRSVASWYLWQHLDNQ